MFQTFGVCFKNPNITSPSLNSIKTHSLQFKAGTGLKLVTFSFDGTSGTITTAHDTATNQGNWIEYQSIKKITKAYLRRPHAIDERERRAIPHLPPPQLIDPATPRGSAPLHQVGEKTRQERKSIRRSKGGGGERVRVQALDPKVE
ncbi:hypothetical protein ACLOJK_018146, partial [Asimina triloba]